MPLSEIETFIEVPVGIGDDLVNDRIEREMVYLKAHGMRYLGHEIIHGERWNQLIVRSNAPEHIPHFTLEKPPKSLPVRDKPGQGWSDLPESARANADALFSYLANGKASDGDAD